MLRAVVQADLIDLARGNMPPVFGVPVASLEPPVSATMDERVGAYYIRFSTAEEGAVSSLLSDVPVASVSSDGTYTVVVTEDTAAETAVQGALGGSDIESSMIRIEGPWG